MNFQLKNGQELKKNIRTEYCTEKQHETDTLIDFDLT